MSIYSQLNNLDAIAREVKEKNYDGFGVLSTGEKLYVALAASDINLLNEMDYTIAQALSRIGNEWVLELIERWEHQS